MNGRLQCLLCFFLAALGSAGAATELGRSNSIQVSTSGGLSSEWTERKYQVENLWAYFPIRKLAPPASSDSQNPIDAFIDERLKQIGIDPAPIADRRALIRRAAFDLTGLPPTPEEIDQFLSDAQSDGQAFSSVVERLLASPHYGEQSARHWLDVVRYADSSGFANDYERGNAWRYRDYVVRSFNNDKPYDQFVREQIAGDELDPDHPEFLIAAGFLRMGPWELTGMEVAQIARQRFLDDVTDTVGQVFLAHPLQCARCHDHKFDPIPTRDYYRLQAVFAPTQFAERDAPFLDVENTSEFQELSYLEKRKEQFEEILARLDAKEEAAARRWCADRGLDYIPRQKGLRLDIAEGKLPPRHIGFTVEDYGIERIARKGLERLQWQIERYKPYAFSVYNGVTPEFKTVNAPLRMPGNRFDPSRPNRRGADAPAQSARLPASAATTLEPTAILIGGNPFAPGEKVAPGTLSVLDLFTSSLDKESPPMLIPEDVDGRRKALADWLASPRNPLTARVMVNRIWQWHFGRGLAANANNFGAMGSKPTHPELLDWLAGKFIESGWSVKAMHRLIMNSQAFRRSSHHRDRARLAEKDPQSTSYAAFKSRRLAAEELRDSMLHVTGELNRAVGGIPVRPEINLEVALQPRQVMGTFAEAWQPSPKPHQRHRRSIYVLKLRGLRDPFFEVFNHPSSDFSCEVRDASTVTPQVFSLFNSQSTHDRALAFATRLQRETDSRKQAIGRAFQLAFGRTASAGELEKCLSHWNEMIVRHRNLHFERTEYPHQIEREAVEENTGQKFRFVEKLRTHDDFVPDRKLSEADAETRALAEVCLVLFNANEFVYIY